MSLKFCSFPPLSLINPRCPQLPLAYLNTAALPPALFFLIRSWTESISHSSQWSSDVLFYFFVVLLRFVFPALTTGSLLLVSEFPVLALLLLIKVVFFFWLCLPVGPAIEFSFPTKITDFELNKMSGMYSPKCTKLKKKKTPFGFFKINLFGTKSCNCSWIHLYFYFGCAFHWTSALVII